MQSIIKKLSLLTILAVLHTVTWAQIKGSRNVIKEERSISGVEKLVLRGAANLYLTQGNNESLTIEADDNIVPIVITEVNGGVLEIGMDKWVRDYEKFNIYLTVKQLNSIKVSGACDIEAKSLFKSNESFVLEVSGATDVDLILEVPSIKCSVSGASDVTLKGNSTQMEVDINGASDFKAVEFLVQKATVLVSGASNADVNVAQEITYDERGASDIRYKGSPNLIKYQK
ncbi:MAG: DUF2807 domain-containing protein [Cytophagales bacterium]|nr:MAG: DUF2807 domain-containing protein [Cytophagales bacterium]